MTDTNAAAHPAADGDTVTAPGSAGDTGVDAAQVADWLRAHPDFFDQHPALLADLRLPRGNGDTVSLVERQLTALRARNAELRSRLDALVATAQQNDALFRRTTALVVDLLACDGVGALQRCLARHLQHEFGAAHVGLVLVTDAADGSDASDSRSEVRRETVTDVERAIGHLLGKGDSFTGAIRSAEAAWLFPGGQRAASAAVLRLQRDGAPLAVLAIGSNDAGHFGSDMGTLFIRHLGDVLVRLLP